jgi:transcriptional regulator with XRE-family HTH domain
METTYEERINEQLPAVIESLRKQNKLSQQALADVTGLSRTYVSDIERGLRNVSVGTLARIGAALGVQASQLLRMAESAAVAPQQEKAALSRQPDGKQYSI